MAASAIHDAVLRAVDDAADEVVDFTQRLIRVPTVNPPGDAYREGAELIADELRRHGFEVEQFEPTDLPEHSADHPRRNVVGGWGTTRPRVHLNGHFDVVPPGHGWTHDPFAGEVENGRIYGRGAADMKGGLAAAVFAAVALKRAGVEPAGAVEISGTVDEESGGYAGVAWLARRGILASDRVDSVIIPEPFGPERICVGHRGVYWFKVEALGEIAHGSMPFLGTNAVDAMAPLLEAVRTELAPALAERRTAMPVVPEEARRATINVNAIHGGQAGQEPQTPCVADHCEAIFDRRFLPEEGLEPTRREIRDLVERVQAQDPSRRYRLSDLMTVEPVHTPADSPLVRALDEAVREVRGKPAGLVASPGTYDHKHVTRIGGIEHCVAYGPGELELAHQPDELCLVDDLIDSTRVMALALLELVGPRS